MGNLFSYVKQKCVGNNELRLVMLGLDSAGKTTIV